MKTIGEVVKQLIRETPFLEEALDEGLINVSSLSRKLKPRIENELHKKMQTGAIIMGIKRYDPGYNYKIKFGLRQFVGNIGDLIVQSGLMHYTFENSKTIIMHHQELINNIMGDQIYYTISRGIFETTVVVSNSITGLIEDIYAKEKLIFQKHNLSAITLRLSTKRDETIGFFYYILKNLAMENINIEELISTTNEFTILVHDNNIDRAFSILMRLKKS